MARQSLSTAEIEAALVGLSGWKLERDALAKEFKFADFKQAMAFMQAVGNQAEAMDHHPEWTNVYNRVAIRLNTHSAGGKVTELDVKLAQAIEAAASA